MSTTADTTAADQAADPRNDSSDAETVEPKDELFDRRQYDDPKLYLDKVDEKDVDKIRCDFSGSVMLDRKNPRDVEFMRRLQLGSGVTLQVEAVCASKKHGYTTGKEGDLDAIVFTGGLKVDSIYWPEPEEL